MTTDRGMTLDPGATWIGEWYVRRCAGCDEELTYMMDPRSGRAAPVEFVSILPTADDPRNGVQEHHKVHKCPESGVQAEAEAVAAGEPDPQKPDDDIPI